MGRQKRRRVAKTFLAAAKKADGIWEKFYEIFFLPSFLPLGLAFSIACSAAAASAEAGGVIQFEGNRKIR